jgi:hypothetical protein
LPAVIVVGVVLYIAIRDRRRADERRFKLADDDAQRIDVENRHLKLVDDDAEQADDRRS